MLDKLTKHHLGIVVAPEDVSRLEAEFGKHFHLDETQGVRVLFRYNPLFGLYEEYITREGRARNYALGFHHVCYAVPSMAKWQEIEAWLKEGRRGFRLTFPERSGSVECGTVTFWQISNLGMVEFTIGDE